MFSSFGKGIDGGWAVSEAAASAEVGETCSYVRLVFRPPNVRVLTASTLNLSSKATRDATAAINFRMLRMRNRKNAIDGNDFLKKSGNNSIHEVYIHSPNPQSN